MANQNNQSEFIIQLSNVDDNPERPLKRTRTKIKNM